MFHLSDRELWIIIQLLRRSERPAHVDEFYWQLLLKRLKAEHERRGKED
jgi:hypothetical protein